MARKMKRTKWIPAKLKTQSISDDMFNDSDLSLTNSERASLQRIYVDIYTRMISIKRNIFLIGESLTEAKRIIGHGHFTKWIENTFSGDLPYSTAYNYMRIYKYFKDKPKLVERVPSKYLMMLMTNQFPAEGIELINNHIDEIDNTKLARINTVYKDFKEGTIGGSQFLKIAEEEIRIGIEIESKSHRHDVNTQMRHTLYFGGGDILERLDSLVSTADKMIGLYPPNKDDHKHKLFIKRIDKMIEKLQKLKKLSEGEKGLFKHSSTENGEIVE